MTGKSDAAGQYLGIATMFIESYALDAFWSIGSLISFGVKYTPTMHLFAACTTQVDVSTSHRNTSISEIGSDPMLFQRSSQIFFLFTEFSLGKHGIDRLKIISAL